MYGYFKYVIMVISVDASDWCDGGEKTSWVGTSATWDANPMSAKRTGSRQITRDAWNEEQRGRKNLFEFFCFADHLRQFLASASLALWVNSKWDKESTRQRAKPCYNCLVNYSNPFFK